MNPHHCDGGGLTLIAWPRAPRAASRWPASGYLQETAGTWIALQQADPPHEAARFRTAPVIHRASAALAAALASPGRTTTIADPMQVALIALALTASMPCEVREIDTGRLIETVAEYMDSTVGPVAGYGIGAMNEVPGAGELLVLLWLPEDPTEVEVLPQEEPVGQVPAGACSKFITWVD